MSNTPGWWCVIILGIIKYQIGLFLVFRNTLLLKIKTLLSCFLLRFIIACPVPVVVRLSLRTFVSHSYGIFIKVRLTEVRIDTEEYYDDNHSVIQTSCSLRPRNTYIDNNNNS